MRPTNDIAMPVGEVVVAVISALVVIAVAAWLIVRTHRRRVLRKPFQHGR